MLFCLNSCSYVVFAGSTCRQYILYGQSDHGTVFDVGRKCYELVPTPRTWQYAENDCVQKGGHLAHIGDSYHQREIYNVVQQSNSGQDVWIGLHDINHEEQFLLILQRHLDPVEIERYLSYWMFTSERNITNRRDAV